MRSRKRDLESESKRESKNESTQNRRGRQREREREIEREREKQRQRQIERKSISHYKYITLSLSGLICLNSYRNALLRVPKKSPITGVISSVRLHVIAIFVNIL